jgi:O-antigen ligase
MSTSTLPRLTERVLAVIALALLCAAAGWGVSHNSKIALGVLALSAGGALLFLFAELQLSALLLWAPISVMAYPLARHLPGQPFVSVDRLWIGALIILLLTLPKAAPMSLPTRRLMTVLLAFAAIFAIRTVTSPDIKTTLQICLDAVLLPVVLFAVVRRAVAASPRVADQLAFSLLIAGVILAGIGIGERMFGYELATAAGGSVRLDESIGTVRISGPYPAPEVYGLTLVVCLAATMYWIQRRGPAAYVTGGIVVGFEVLAIALTYFRVAWIGAAAVIVLSLALRPGRAGRGVGIVLLTAAVLALSFSGLQHISAVKERVQNTDNFYGRIATYKQGFQVWKEAPIFGVGVDQYHNKAVDLPEVAVNGVASQPYAHSSFEGTLAEEGVIGLALLILVAVYVWRLLRELRRAARRRADTLLVAATAGAALAYVLFSLSLTMITYGPNNAMLCVLLGMVAGRLDWIRGEPEESEATAETPA